MTMLTQLARVARRTGYPVVEVPGWRTRGRPGGMGDIRTITCHHTANGGAPGNYPSLRVVRDGRRGLPGPLAHYGLGVDGTIYVIAAGKCNHAGVSRSVDYLNSHAIGIEAEAEGTGDPDDWPPAQRESYERLCAALVDEFPVVDERDVRGHKETCAPDGRKSDPSLDMARHRARVAAVDLSQPPKELNEMTGPEWAKLQRMIDAAVTKLRAEFVEVLTKDELVVNRVTKATAAADPNAKPSKGSITWALGNIEGDIDDDRNSYLEPIAAATSDDKAPTVAPPGT